MYQIATLNKISKVGLAELSDEYMITEKVEDAAGILVRSQDMLTMEFSKELKAIARAGAGVNNIPLDRCAEAGIVVFNTPGANANAVKELTIAGLLLACRNIPAALTWAKGLSEDVSKTVEKGKSQFAGHEITGKTLGVVGLGAIGRKVAAAASALGMKIVGYDPFFNGDADYQVYTDLKEMLPLCDYVTIHVPANDNTKGMFNKELFSAMKEGAVLLNFSRDKLVNDVDLLVAVETGKVSQYITDFPNDNLVGREGVVLLPHLGASTEEAEDNCAVMAVNEIRDYFENGNVINSVNFPKADLGPIGDNTRIAFLVKDMDDPVVAMTEHLSEAGIAIKKIVGGNKKGFGYVLAEIDSKELPGLIFHDENIIATREIRK
ncbi:MAG: 3-phosphoglycerate dehydrogenase [Firmicutes bacterium]|nr:3-phosphoglycerate dehydrogenase [Bacillota bacterium]